MSRVELLWWELGKWQELTHVTFCTLEPPLQSRAHPRTQLETSCGEAAVLPSGTVAKGSRINEAI